MKLGYGRATYRSRFFTLEVTEPEINSMYRGMPKHSDRPTVPLVKKSNIQEFPCQYWRKIDKNSHRYLIT
jgi:hypothetical protein